MTDKVPADAGAPMDAVVAGLSTKADKIRALDRAGYARADIATHLGIRYQHVYNVLKRAKSERPASPTWVKVGEGGRVVIPAPYRRAMGVADGDHVQLCLERGEVRMVSRATVIRRVQARVADSVEPGRSLVDELIAERRREAAREEAGE